jgi:hypothetical protein
MGINTKPYRQIPDRSLLSPECFPTTHSIPILAMISEDKKNGLLKKESHNHIG